MNSMNKKIANLFLPHLFKITIFLVVTLLAAGLTSCNPDSSGESNLQSLIDRLNDLFQLGKTPGAVLTIIKDFQVDQVITFGVKDYDTQEPVTAQTLFQAASISKPVTGVAAMRFVQDGTISLDTNVNNKLVSWQVPDNQFTVTEKVTLRRLLGHRGGIPQGGKVGTDRDAPYPTLLDILNGVPPYDPVRVTYIPGSDFIYSNEGYCIVQQLLMDISQKSFPKLIKDIIFTPLNMNSSTFEQQLTPEWETRAASGHNGYSVLEGKYQLHPKLAAAGLWTTSEDLARFLIEFLLSLQGRSNIILDLAIINHMIESLTKFDDTKDYGVGIGIKYFGGETYYWHSGGFEGFNCVMYGHETAGVGMVLMTNHCDLEWEVFIEAVGTHYNWPGF